SPSLPEAGPETLTATSALGLVLTTVPVTVAGLFAGLGAGVVALTEAGSVKGAPVARLGGAKATRVKASRLPEGMLAVAVSVTVPPDCPKVKESAPDVRVIDTKVDPAGRVSVRTTP